MLDELRKTVCNANKELQKQNLVIYSFGNVSAIDRNSSTIAIKPSGVPYDQLTPDKIVFLDLEGNAVEGNLNPSSDTPTHLELYRNFPDIGGVCHTHSTYATMWAQACTEIPCFGTTHADSFFGPVPVTKRLSKKQIQESYELNTGRIIIERFSDIDPLETPAVLVANHGPFTWAETPQKAVKNAVILEEIAKTALGTITVNPNQKQIDNALLEKHFLRKHGKNSYYGQK